MQLQACNNVGCGHVMKRTVQQCHACKTTRKTVFSGTKLHVAVGPTTSRGGKESDQPDSCSGRLHIRGAYTSGITGKSVALYSHFPHAKELRKLFVIWECTLKMFASHVLGRKSLNNVRLTGAEL